VGYRRDSESGWRGSSHSSTSIRDSSEKAHALVASFRGTFDYTLDAKNRLTVPAKFRAALAEGVVMAKGTEPCVALWVPESYDEFTESILATYHPFSEEREKLERFYASNSFDADLDSAGRVGFPPFLLQHAGLTKEVVVAGARNRLEVWDRDRWNQKNDELVSDVREIRSRVSHAGS
jgi:MraZ protein